jgi:hypothetical protein
MQPDESENTDHIKKAKATVFSNESIDVSNKNHY